MSSDFPCRICAGDTAPIGSKWGYFRKREFHLRRCPECGYAFVADPWTDYAAIYSEDYYAGKGADPLVDYQYELDHPDETIRLYEWRGIARAVSSLVRIDQNSSGSISAAETAGWCGTAGNTSGAVSPV